MDWRLLGQMVVDCMKSFLYLVQVQEPPRNAAYSVALARTRRAHRIFASLRRLVRSNQLELSQACEDLQVYRFFAEPLDLRRKRKLNYFRLTQRMRDEHGTERGTPPPNFFQSFEDIVKLERDIEVENFVAFTIQCMRLALVDSWQVFEMFRKTCTVEQLAALFDECVLMLERCKCDDTERIDLVFRFQNHFKRLTSSARPYKRPLWRDLKMFLERVSFLEHFHEDALPTDVDIPDEDIDEALSFVLSNADRLQFNLYDGELAYFLMSLLERGASLYYRDQHGVSSLRRLLGLGSPEIDRALQLLSTYICCPLKKEEGKIIVDNRRLARLSCLAAMRIPLSTIEEQLPSKLRPSVRAHKELRGVLTGSIQRPEQMVEWKGQDDDSFFDFEVHNRFQAYLEVEELY